jgi:hypothetical protein
MPVQIQQVLGAEEEEEEGQAGSCDEGTARPHACKEDGSRPHALQGGPPQHLQQSDVSSNNSAERAKSLGGEGGPALYAGSHAAHKGVSSKPRSTVGASGPTQPQAGNSSELPSHIRSRSTVQYSLASQAPRSVQSPQPGQPTSSHRRHLSLQSQQQQQQQQQQQLQQQQGRGGEGRSRPFTPLQLPPEIDSADANTEE